MLDLFIPRKIGSRQILPEKRLAIHIAKPWIYATLASLDRKGAPTIETFSEMIITDNGEDALSATTIALRTILDNVGHYNTLISSLNSSHCICKSVFFPFASEEKARLVITHELESSLPYKLNDAICDAYVTQVHPEENSLQAIGVSTQRQFLEQHLEPFRQLGTLPDIVTTDVCALYTLSGYVPNIAQSPVPTILIYIGARTTTLLMMQNGQYRASRSVKRGVIHIAQSLQQSPSETLRLLQTTESDSTINESAQKALYAFWKELKFTVESFLKHSSKSFSEAQIVLSGKDSVLTGLCNIISNDFHSNCTSLSLSYSIESGIITSSHSIPSTHAISLGAALPSHTSQSFNLLKMDFAPTQTQAITQTLLISTGLIATTLLGAAAVTWFRADSLSQQVEQGAQEGVELLRKSFTPKEVTQLGKDIPNATASLPSLVKKAKRIVDKQESLWQKFTQSAQSSFLYHLYILFNEIDPKAFGLVVEKLSMDSNGIVSLRARVRDLNALEIFNDQLPKSPHFTLLSPPPQNPSFDIKLQVHNGQG